MALATYKLQGMQAFMAGKTKVKGNMMLAQKLEPAIARGTSCPGHVVVPWAHSPIWSRQDPNCLSDPNRFL